MKRLFDFIFGLIVFFNPGVALDCCGVVCEVDFSWSRSLLVG
jgi:hypothetical protein